MLKSDEIESKHLKSELVFEQNVLSHNLYCNRLVAQFNTYCLKTEQITFWISDKFKLQMRIVTLNKLPVSKRGVMAQVVRQTTQD